MDRGLKKGSWSGIGGEFVYRLFDVLEHTFNANAQDLAYDGIFGFEMVIETRSAHPCFSGDVA
ncbi:hypothetical protein DFLDMN_000195 [Cupriavidus sp. H19C3]